MRLKFTNLQYPWLVRKHFVSYKTFFWERYFLLLFVSICLLGCRKTSNESGSQTDKKAIVQEAVDYDLSEISKRGKIIAIVDNNTTSYFLYKGKAMGYEYELLKMLADELNLELELNITTDIDDTFSKLNEGEGDIIAFNLAVTKERAKRVNFTTHHSTSRQVLIQRKPIGWREMKKHQIEQALIRDPIELIGKEVYVRKSSSYAHRLQNLSEEIGGDIIIVEEFGNMKTEELVRKVSDGEIDYTVADEDVAMVNASYHPNIDVKTAISFPQRIAWAVRRNSPELLNAINQWIADVKRKPDYNVIYNRYFKSNKAHVARVKSEFSSIGGNHISIYDSLIREGATKIGWDWKLLAAQIYQESRFDPKAKSWAGAIGLMQLIPETGSIYGAIDLESPQENIDAGTNYLEWLSKLWLSRVKDKQERIKFILASFNVGQGHVMDAQRLAEKYGSDPERWDDNVEKYLLLKSDPKYFSDPVVGSGYCRGLEPVKYVREILHRYTQYNQLFAVKEAL
ncbi:transporter substrate-binding domain-containing protein [Fulvivirgaceae bacterium BMA10]|uniref:Transporter substrate-binding domain-containing protein n=1 Tax=Splendidivirga corallicola TaxID=3051826 RepID=A0ABT8KM52_9BACT|nr:transporter substrate-binding domain-containing protein [Fulvivirgaceae bacterium BMA10]